MKKSITLTVGFLIGLLVGQLPLSQLEVQAAPPGSTTTFTISTQADKDYLLNHELVAKELARRAKRVVTSTATAAAWSVKVGKIGTRARAGLVGSKPGLDGLMPADIIDIALGYTDANLNGLRDSGENDVVRMWLNADAAVNRESPPAGIAVGP